MKADSKLHLMASTAMLYAGTALQAPLLKADSTIIVVVYDNNGTKYLLRTTIDIANVLDLKVAQTAHAQGGDFIAAGIDIVENLKGSMAMAYGRNLTHEQIADTFDIDISTTGHIQQAEIKTLIDLKIDTHGSTIVTAAGPDANVVDLFGKMRRVHVMNSFGISSAEHGIVDQHVGGAVALDNHAVAHQPMD